MLIRFLKDWNPRHGYIKYPKGTVGEHKDKNAAFYIREGIAEAVVETPETATAEPVSERAVLPKTKRRKRAGRKAPTRSNDTDGQ